MSNLRETIRDTTKEHLDSGGTLFAQCTKAVGWIGGTVPNDTKPESIIELPTSDVSNGGVVTGFGLSGKRPIYVIRYQGFITYNGSSIVNYAAKSKEMWKTPCPIFVRSIGMEGSIGPVASNCHHSAVMRFPGIRVHAPITPTEWLTCWRDFMDHDDPMYCSEHRLTYDLTDDIITGSKNLQPYPVDLIIGIGYARIAAYEASKKLNVDFGSITQLKPLNFSSILEYILERCEGRVLVVDSDYTTCGAAEHIAMEIMKKYPVKAYALGLDDRSAGFSPLKDNITPSVEKIISFMENLNG